MFKIIKAITAIRCMQYMCCGLLLFSCNEKKNESIGNAERETSTIYTYADDRNFLKEYTPIIELQNEDSRILIAPMYQARIMTSTCNGDSGYSFGWINYALIKSGLLKEHINPFGGEERLWLAPEGGQFSFFFRKGVSYDFKNWFTPKELDTDSFHTYGKSNTSALFKKDMVLKNRSGNDFFIHIDRKISLLDRKRIEENLKTEFGSKIKAVAYESVNTLINSGQTSWTRQTGAPAIWLLGMLKPSPQTTIVLPIRKGLSDTTGVVRDKYFGTIPPDRWKVEETHAYLKGDGKFRGKVGLPPQHTTDFIGSFDAVSKVLTLLQCEWPQGIEEFVNSAWEDQKDPFSGDAFNAYNDGPLADGTQLGPFYELESSSPAAFLQPGKSLTHIQITYHLQGEENELNKIAEQFLGVGLEAIRNAFNKR